MRTRSGILEWAGHWIGLVPLLAEIVGVDPQRRAVGMFVGQIRDGRLAEQFGGHEFAGRLGAPGFVERDFEVAAVGLLDQFERRIELRFDQRRRSHAWTAWRL